MSRTNHPITVSDVFRQLCANPYRLLIRRWNWKSSLFSSTLRAAIFFFANLAAGFHAALGAMLAEFCYRAATAGVYGAITQAFRKADPEWAAMAVVMLVLPLSSHALELTIHLLRGTPRLLPSFIASVCMTGLSTLFNLYAMRRGALLAGSDAGSVATDLRRMPRLIAGFVAAPPLAIYRWLHFRLMVPRQTAEPQRQGTFSTSLSK